jgi:hypothetical protein
MGGQSCLIGAIPLLAPHFRLQNHTIAGFAVNGSRFSLPVLNGCYGKPLFNAFTPK